MSWVSETFPVQLDGPRAHCAEPAYLPLVDAAFERPGGPAASTMKTRVCPGCPIGEDCLDWAMTRREEGVWGGHGPKGRTQHGAPGSDDLGKSTDFTSRASSTYDVMTAVDVPSATIRAWALAQGFSIHPQKGRISKEIRKAYVAAHMAP